MERNYTMNSDPSIVVPHNLSREYLEKEFGAEATAYYENRIAERRANGKVYYNPTKMMFLWMTEDRESRRGFYGNFIRNFNSGKMKNHGGS